MTESIDKATAQAGKWAEREREGSLITLPVLPSSTCQVIATTRSQLTGRLSVEPVFYPAICVHSSSTPHKDNRGRGGLGNPELSLLFQANAIIVG